MGLFKKTTAAVALLILLTTSVACSAWETTPAALFFFAAASTTDAVREITNRFEAETQIPVRLNLAASSTLAQQILAGAGADLFLSANTRWVDVLVRKGLVEKRRNLLGNQLVIIVPAGASTPIQAVRNLLDSEISRFSIADPEGVPAGIYAKQALLRLGLWQSLEPKVVRGFDVRQVLFFVEQGEAQAGIVYATDAAISEAVRPVLELEPDLSEPICYPLVLMKSSRREAVRLFEHLISPGSLRTFGRYGFSVQENDISCTGQGR
ncbi:MAG: molybdate ABC transporter substrate-binding protein [Acidobacteriota bacterium]